MVLIPVVPHATPEEMSVLVSSYGDVPMAVRVPGHTLAHLSSATTKKLAECEWTFLIGGWSEPILASLPESSRRLQIERELSEFRSLGINMFAGFVGSGWEQQLVTLFVEQALREVFVSWSPPYPLTPLVTDHLGDVLTLLAMGSPLAPIVSDPPAIPAGASPLATVLSHFEAHRGQPVTDRSWAKTIDGDPEAALLYRKMLRLAGRMRKDMPAEAMEWVLAAQTATWLDPGVDRTAAHAALVAARHRIDLARRRPDRWLRTTRRDWDADGEDEVQIENEQLSMLMDHRAGMISYVDHKPSERSVSYLPGELPWHLARGLTGHTPTRIKFAECEIHEERGGAKLQMAGSGLQLTVSVIDSTIGFAYRLHPSFAFERLGPELPLVTTGPVRLKVDGGEWSNVTETLARGGHRFRLDAGSYEILLALVQPGDLFLRPATGGIVAWPNWPALTGEYRLTVEIMS